MEFADLRDCSGAEEQIFKILDSIGIDSKVQSNEKLKDPLVFAEMTSCPRTCFKLALSVRPLDH